METRYCKRCLIEELGEEKYREMIENHIGIISEEDRCEDNEYSRRLDICGGCGKLNHGTCFSCGCYVEIRAALKRAKCPNKKW